MLDLEEKNTNILNLRVQRSVKEARAILHASSTGSWYWCVDTFADALEWLMNHPAQLRRGEYLSVAFGKEAWHLRLPDAFGGIHIMYRRIDGYKLPLFKRFSPSLSLNEALNFAAFNKIKINVPDVLACGESRTLGMLRSSFIITRYVQQTFDGTVLMPGGQLCDNTALRMGFCRNLMEYIARLHLAEYTSIDFHPRKVLFPMKCYEKNPPLTWVDAESCRFVTKGAERERIPRDLLSIFVALRLTTKEIQELCECYLDANTFCGYTPQTLWQGIVSFGEM